MKFNIYLRFFCSICTIFICSLTYSQDTQEESKNTATLYDASNNITQTNKELPIAIQSIYGKNGELVQETYSDGSNKYYLSDGSIVIK